MENVFSALQARIKRTKDRHSQRILKKKMPLTIELPKSALLLHGSHISILVREFISDLQRIKNPFCQQLSNSNDINPFEQRGIESIEFLAQKNDSALVALGLTSKKRGDSIVFGRLFSYQLTDLIELCIESYSPMMEFASQVESVLIPGSKPYIQFSGDAFDSSQNYAKLKNLLLDFFTGPKVKEICVSSSNLVLSFFAIPGLQEGSKDKLVMKSYLMKHDQSLNISMKEGIDQINPELEEFGPSAIFSLGREFYGADEIIKESYKLPPTHGQKKKHLIKAILPGEINARIHVEKQDLNELNKQTKRPKAIRHIEKSKQKVNQEKEKNQQEIKEDENRDHSDEQESEKERGSIKMVKVKRKRDEIKEENGDESNDQLNGEYSEDDED
ncbi:MAG: putative ribosome production factor 2 [Streblomastix strix]|uniref:Ribosome production factor 2 homolog n=1 Tax=Streblomastix strix TaxID=222440 RepID=A0A5J4WXU4_9EUKA|nr:MAG: putative ribosome production factor 2 [Streblomastix strix]